MTGIKLNNIQIPKRSRMNELWDTYLKCRDQEAKRYIMNLIDKEIAHPTEAHVFGLNNPAPKAHKLNKII